MALCVTLVSKIKISYTRIIMENLNEEIILKTLSFIVENDNKISRYTLDKFITKSFLFNESFNIIPLYLGFPWKLLFKNIAFKNPLNFGWIFHFTLYRTKNNTILF